MEGQITDCPSSTTCLAKKVGSQQLLAHCSWVSLTPWLQKSHFSAKSGKEQNTANKYYFNIAPNKLGDIVGDGEEVRARGSHLPPGLRPRKGERDGKGSRDVEKNL